jgi:hypothetical protein
VRTHPVADPGTKERALGIASRRHHGATRTPRRPVAACISLLSCAALILTSGCARLLTRPSRLGNPDPAAIIAAAAAHERALGGLKLTLSVRATAGPPAARLASPAYLAIDDAEHLRLQVLSPFGVTVLDLRTAGDLFTLMLPLRGETRTGRIDLGALAAGTTPDDERMIVALALLFRPKVERTRCRSAAPSAIRCTIAPDLSATINVNDALRVVREDYIGAGDRPVLSAELSEYGTSGIDALPGRIVISDGAGGAALVIRVVKARRATDPPPS